MDIHLHVKMKRTYLIHNHCAFDDIVIYYAVNNFHPNVSCDMVCKEHLIIIIVRIFRISTRLLYACELCKSRIPQLSSHTLESRGLPKDYRKRK